MEDDVVRKVVELIFHKQVINTAAMTAPDSSIPACLLTRDFSRSMQVVLITKQIILHYRWKKFVDTCYKNMFNSHEMYLRYIMFACQTEHNCHKEIFEKFISVCAVLLNLSVETFLKTKMYFCDLNPDIFMVFYQIAMKKKFLEHDGFQGLKEYIDGHRYLEWDTNNHLTHYGLSYKVEKITEEIDKLVCELTFESDEIANDVTSFLLAQKVLSIPSVRFPPLLSKSELVQNLVECRRNDIRMKAEVKRNFIAALQSQLCGNTEKTETAEARREIVAALNFKSTEEVREGCSKSIADSKTNYTTEEKEDVIKFEDIIEAVIRYNNSISSSHENLNNRLQKDAYEILEHLKDNIHSFIELLDEYDEE